VSCDYRKTRFSGFYTLVSSEEDRASVRSVVSQTVTPVLGPSKRGFEDIAARVFSEIPVSHIISLLSEFQIFTNKFIQIKPSLFISYQTSGTRPRVAVALSGD
jgi:hypothetical protein